MLKSGKVECPHESIRTPTDTLTERSCVESNEKSAAFPAGLRVLHLDDGRSWRGGQHQVWLLMNELALRGVEQCLAVQTGSPLAKRSGELPVRVEEFCFRGELDPFSPARIARLSMKFGSNILHAHTSHTHGLMLRCRDRLPDSTPLLSTRRVDFPIGRNLFSRRKYNLPSQHFIAISGAVRKALLKAGVSENRVDLVHSGVPPLPPERAISRDQVREEFRIREHEIAILSIGALTDHKGHRFLVDAAPHVIQAHPNVRFHIMGEGELRKRLQGQIDRLSMRGHFMLHGFVPDARLKQSGFDIYASSSHLEGLGTSILDAMLANLPVVASAAGGISDIIMPDQTGILVKAADSNALAEGLVRMIDNESGRGVMTREARERVENLFSPCSMAEGTLRVYKNIASKQNC